ncbi:Eukaryotic translation initiation factor 4 gamma 1 [Camelus dromedarius]|uniref:Eukaryotic translation initiation factor 4 gamma 1 n=1 Tax=Camelus dromedarius TaxID=9838 RepID=A0A5N4D797_CAMDR|nr:Eukaryotic translation initiation factor 4 gamma 1 [Camelus dromedarius]
MTKDKKMNKAEKAWKPSSKRMAAVKDRGEEDADGSKTQDLFRRVRSILNKLTPQMFQQLIKQVMQLTIDTEECLKGVIDLIFKKAISEPNYSVAYANMCRSKEFEKDKDDDEVFERKQKEMDEAATAEERGLLRKSWKRLETLSWGRREKAGDRGDCLERSERGGDRGDRLDRARTPATKRSFSKEVEEWSREPPSRPEGLCKAASLMEDRGRGRGAVKQEAALPQVSSLKAKLSEEELQKKSRAIIEEHLHLSDMKEAVQCYCQGLYEILELAEDVEIGILHEWLYLAELVTPILQDKILGLLCRSMGPKKVGMLWREAGLSWKESLPEDQDVGAFVTAQKLESTLGEESESPGQRLLSSEELSGQLKLLKESSSNQRVFDRIEANLSAQQVASNTLVRALMTTACYSAIIFETPLREDVAVLKARAKLLQKYLCDEQKELQALYALQALVVTLEQPANLLRTFFDALCDEDAVKEDAFYSWESSKDPAEQQGKGVALTSVPAFFKWLREAEEEESDRN